MPVDVVGRERERSADRGDVDVRESGERLQSVDDRRARAIARRVPAHAVGDREDGRRRR